MAKKPVQSEIPMEGADVAPVKDKKLEALADDFIEKRDAKAELAEEMTAIESKIIDRMTELKVPVFRYADKEVCIKAGKVHAKVKTVKNDGQEGEFNE